MAKSRKYENRLQNGEAVIEFYANLKEIKDLYFNKGYRKITLLHRTLKKKFNWKMSYDTFRYHFNKEFGTKQKRELISDNSKMKDSNHSSQTKKVDDILENVKTKSVKNDPPIAKANFKSGKRFNPHTVDIDPSRII